MLELYNLQLFISTAALLALSPGPDNLYVLSQSAIHGRLAGLFIVLGLCVGLIFHTIAVAVGLAALISSTPWLYTTIKLVGAGYLFYLGIQSFRSSAIDLSNPEQKTRSTSRFFLRGVVMNISNPKVALFFLALLPPFIQAEQGNIGVQSLQLGGVFILVTFVVFSLFILLATPIRYWLTAQPQRQNVMHQLTGVFLVLLACYIAFFSA